MNGCAYWFHHSSLTSKKKSNYHYIRRNMPKRVRSGVPYFLKLVPGQHTFKLKKKTSQHSQVVGDAMSDLTSSGNKPQTYCTNLPYCNAIRSKKEPFNVFSVLKFVPTINVF